MFFSERGGEFITSPSEIITKAEKIKMLIFDWDGVFNSGVKGDGVFSNFSEVDGMGINMFRFGYHLKNQFIPYAGVISGQLNKSTEMFARREKLSFMCLGFKYKIDAFEKVKETFGIEDNEVAFIFDDVLDLSLAMRCGLRFMVRRKASPMFDKYVKINGLADYVTACCGEEFAVREVCELILASIGAYNDAIFHRTNCDDVYKNYLKLRNSRDLSIFSAPKII